jgi:ABC-2 type transport system ATP-binding protein
MSAGAPIPAIETHGLGKSYGEVVALRGIDLRVERGEFLGLFGPNGAGKTTMLRILTGQIAPTSGTATVLGLPVPDRGVEVRARVGVVPEFESPPSFLTGEEYLRFVCRARGITDSKERAQRWLEFFTLTDRKGLLCKDMSKGMRQKVMLAAAFIHEPELMFLDEPFINLDPLYQKRVQEYLREYLEGGGTVFMCSHLLEIAERLCTRLVVIKRGSVVGQGTLAELKLPGELNLNDVFMRLVGGELGDTVPAGPEGTEASIGEG